MNFTHYFLFYLPLASSWLFRLLNTSYHLHAICHHQIYAWPLLQTAFSEVFTQNEWLILWDNLLCHPPGVLLATVVAYAVCSRGPLLLVKDIEKFEVIRLLLRSQIYSLPTRTN
ncbi:WD repeat-containing protein 67 [Fasciolopsis buskii]|uniref:WD repeat-containing protein 67 n=1 Tax=Fasciolopsis buskii TaxID=27845 RepID=A0A8E0RKM7_9TREM|nr:WD repeat-containing protein 67 [Fasciolopsis buski]